MAETQYQGREMNENPYAVSASPIETETPIKPTNDESLLSIARQVFLTWEKLRILYIGILGMFTLLLVGFSGLPSLSLMITVMFGAIVSNCLYFAGPIVDTYIRWLGYRDSWPRLVMFVVGTIFSLILALGLLGAHLLPNQP